ncbi:hypothetical protein FOMPIDRAFT_1129209, partial [Fomitopsis schrenkii]
PFTSYRTANMILASILPGPKEQDSDEIQRFMRIFVNELLRLWHHGFKIKSSKFGVERLVRVILICVCCDKPAAHKLGGFGSHSHTFFCTRCWIRQAEKATAEAFKRGAFPTRSHAEQMKFAQEYAHCETQAARDEFVKLHASRWCELARLPYFDVCRMIVIDPMHNLLLGLVKTHFYHIWIQLKVLRKTKELRRFHDILSKLDIPAYLGRLPTLMGQPAGGSLTADQWLIAATVILPIALPQIWDEYCTGESEVIRLQRIGKFKDTLEQKKRAQAEARKRREAERSAASATTRRSGRKRRRTERALVCITNTILCVPRLMRRASVQWVDELPPGEAEIPDAGAQEPDDHFDPSDSEQADSAHANLHPDDPAHFFKLTKFLNLVLAVKVDDRSIDEAEVLIREYCTELMHLYGTEVVRPNHHYATDVPDCLRDFGPLHGFWTFLFERMNKVLKSYNSANHAGGELEVSFFREFHRTVQQSRMATAYVSNNAHIRASIDAMYYATADDRGTVQALAQQADEHTEDGGIMFAMSQRGSQQHMGPVLYDQVLRYLKVRGLDVRSHLALGAGPPLFPDATFFDYVVISQRRYWSSARNNNRTNSLATISLGPRETAVGELVLILAVSQPHVSDSVFYLGEVRWLVPATEPYHATSAWRTTYVN